MLLTRKSAGASAPDPRRAEPPAPQPVRRARQDHRSPRVPQALGRGCRRRRVREPAAVQHDRQGRGGATERGRQGRSEAHRLHPLLGRLRHRRRGAERRLGAPGAGVRLAAQSRRALRQGRLGARARHDRAFAPPEVPDEAGERQVQAHLLGPGASTRSATGCWQSARNPARTRSTSSARPSTTTSRPICCASGCRCGAPTTATTRRASATRPRSRASPTPGATAR